MAESSQTSGIDKQLFGAKDEPGRKSTPETQGGEEATKAQSNGRLESGFKGQESSYFVPDKKNTVDNSEMNTAGKGEIFAEKKASETATDREESTLQDSKKIATTEETAKESTNKEGQGEQETQRTQELKSNEKQTLKPDQANSSKKGRLSFRRSKKGKISKRKASLDEEKRVEILKCETIAEDPKIFEEKTEEICDKRADKADEAKFETVEGSVEMENREPFTSPEGVQNEKSTATNNKGMNIKQFASFRQTTKGKYNVSQTFNTDACEGHGERSEKFESPEDRQDMDVEETSLKLPVAADKGESNEKDDEREEKADPRKKETGKQKKKVTVLSFKRNKQSLKKPKGKSSKKDEEKSEINASAKIGVGKETNDVNVMDGGALRKQADFEEKISNNREERKSIVAEEEDATAEEKSGSVEEKQGNSLENEESNAEKEDGSAKAHEVTRELSLKKKKKENILRRSLRKFTNPSSVPHGKKKSKGDEKTVNADKGARKRNEEEDKNECSGLEESVEEQSVAQKDTEEKSTECEENSKAVKRKKELTDSNRELKRQREDHEIEIQDKDALGETADVVVVVEVKQDAKTSEVKSNVADDLENGTTKELNQEKENSADELNCEGNKELSPQRNKTDEQEEVKADVEISQEIIAREAKQIETSAEGLGGRVVEVRVVIDEQAKKNKEEETKAEETKGSSDEGNAFTEIQRQTSETKSESRHRHLDGYDSDLTVVTALAYPFTEDDELSESDTSGTDANTEDDEIQAIAEVHVIPPEIETSAVEGLVETTTDPDTEDEEVRVINEGVSSETGVLRDGNEGNAKLVPGGEHEVDTPTQSNELENTLTAEEEPAIREEQNSRDGSTAQSLQSSFQNPAEEWIMVHRLDVTEEIALRLMTVLPRICKLRRNVSCCTVM